MNQGLLLCAKGYWGGRRAIVVGRGLLPCAKGYCRGPRAIAVGRGLLLGAGGLLPWAKGYCRIYIYTGKQRAGAVSKGLLPWTKTETPP